MGPTMKMIDPALHSRPSKKPKCPCCGWKCLLLLLVLFLLWIILAVICYFILISGTEEHSSKEFTELNRKVIHKSVYGDVDLTPNKKDWGTVRDKKRTKQRFIHKTPGWKLTLIPSLLLLPLGFIPGMGSFVLARRRLGAEDDTGDRLQCAFVFLVFCCLGYLAYKLMIFMHGYSRAEEELSEIEA